MTATAATEVAAATEVRLVAAAAFRAHAMNSWRSPVVAFDQAFLISCRRMRALTVKRGGMRCDRNFMRALDGKIHR